MKKFTGVLLDMESPFLNRKVHIVAVAVNALTTYNYFVQVIGGFNHEEATKYANTFNDENETGTLYPRLNLSALPLSVYGKRNDSGNETIMGKNIDDCFLAETKYIKSGYLLFILDDRSDFDVKLAEEILDGYDYDPNLRVEYIIY